MEIQPYSRLGPDPAEYGACFEDGSEVELQSDLEMSFSPRSAMSFNLAGLIYN